MEKSLVTFSFDTLSKIARKTRFCRTYTSTLTEITDSVKKESKTLVFDSFYMFFSIFEAFSEVKICKLTMPFSLLIFGVFLKNQGLNLSLIHI